MPGLDSTRPSGVIPTASQPVLLAAHATPPKPV